MVGSSENLVKIEQKQNYKPTKPKQYFNIHYRNNIFYHHVVNILIQVKSLALHL